MASYYDLVVGLHPDEATKPIAQSAKHTSTLLIPCCNFWDQSRKVGRDALIEEISRYYDKNKIKYELVTLNFNSPKNVGLLSFKSQLENLR